jgi:hypothetical protein
MAEAKPKTSSILDGAVDDLFGSGTETQTATSAANVSQVTLFAGQQSKSELVFDEEGNMVLQQVSGNGSGDRISAAVEATTTVESATCGYDFAYRRPKPTRWSNEDTDRFYEALELYGSDQMLINTALPHFTAVQIRQKFKAEERNNPIRFKRVLYGSKKKISSIKFEQQHGLIANPVVDHKIDEISNYDFGVAEGGSHSLEDNNDPPQEASSAIVDTEDPLASIFR